MKKHPLKLWQFVVLALFLVFAVTFVLWSGKLGVERQQKAQVAAELRKEKALAGSVTLLPKNGAGAALLLGRERAQVRAALGEPSESNEKVDVFASALGMRFRYENDRSRELLFPLSAEMNELKVRRWLGIGPGASHTVDGNTIRVTLKADALQLTLEETVLDLPPLAASKTSAKTKKVQTSPASEARILRLAAELVRSFPEVPEELEGRCESSRRGSTFEMACVKGVDAPVEYVFASNRTWGTLTVLGPPGTNERAACRKWLLAAVPGAKLDETRQQDDEMLEYYTKNGIRYMVGYLTLDHHRDGARCSVMACLEDSRGNGRSCRPR